MNKKSIIQVTPTGIALLPGMSIPEGLVENRFRLGNYGIIDPKTGKFKEVLRINPPTDKGFAGPNYSHYHINNSKEHFSPRPGDNNPGF